MVSVLVTNRKNLLLGVAILCFPSAAFGMETDELQLKKGIPHREPHANKKVLFQLSTCSTSTKSLPSAHSQLQARLKFLDEFEEKKLLNMGRNKLEPSNPRVNTRLSRQCSSMSLSLSSQEDSALTQKNICKNTPENTYEPQSPRLGYISTRNAFLFPQEATISSINPRESPHSSRGTKLLSTPSLILGKKASKQHIDNIVIENLDEKIKQNFDMMQYYNAKSMTHLEWLRFSFSKKLEIVKDEFKEPGHIKGKNIEQFEPEELLNIFWNFNITDLLKNTEKLCDESPDALELIGGSAKFLIENLVPKEKKELGSKTLSISKMDLSSIKLHKKTSKSKIEPSHPKKLSKTISKTKLNPLYEKELGQSAIVCYQDLARRCISLCETFPVEQKYLYYAAKYFTLIGEFDEKYYKNAWQLMLKCPMFPDYIDEDYESELEWIKLLKVKKIGNLMEGSLEHDNAEAMGAIAKDYLQLAHIEEKIIEIENYYAKDAIYEDEEYRFINHYLEGFKYYYLHSEELCFCQMATLPSKLLFHFAPQAHSRSTEDEKYKNLWIALYQEAYRLLFKEYKKFADQGDGEAECALGYLYENGFGTHKDEEEAIKWYKSAAHKWHTKAQENLEKMYKTNRGVPKNEKEMLEYYDIAVEKDNPEAAFNLGLMYEEGRGVDKDESDAAKYYKIAANKGHVLAQNKLGNMYEYGIGVDEDYKQAFLWHQRAAEGKNMDSQDALGWMYSTGRGVEKQDKYEAFQWYKRAADQGHAKSMMCLVEAYRNGDGVLQNPEQAVVWCRKASDQGGAEAQYVLALFYRDGYGLQANKREAFRWCEKSADQGNKNAIELLVRMYATLYVVAPKQKEEAKKWHEKALAIYKRATELGDTVALVKLADAYHNGHGVEKNPAQALQMYELAAEHGNVTAQFMVGWIYDTGVNGEKDIPKAIKFYLQAADQGDVDACYALSGIYRQGMEQNLEASEKWRLLYEERMAKAEHEQQKLHL